MKLNPMLLAALIPMAAAQTTPTIIGTLPNRDNANITFTSIQGECPKDQYIVYTQADGGKISLYGCYRLVSDQFFVKWSDGDVYTYPSGNLILSDEFLNYMNRNKK
jgi:hypothetical protein